MKRVSILSLGFLTLSLLSGDEPKVKVWVGVQKEGPVPAWSQPMPKLDGRQLRLQLGSPLDAFLSPSKGSPGATVVVWGEASYARQEEMNQFARDYAPLFRTAFDVGTSASVGGQMLSRLVELSANPNQNPAPAIAPSVWYNSMDPWARNPKFYK